MLTHGQKKIEPIGRRACVNRHSVSLNLEILKCNENILKVPPNLVSQPRKYCHWPYENNSETEKGTCKRDDRYISAIIMVRWSMFH